MTEPPPAFALAVDNDLEILLGDSEWDAQHREFHKLFGRLEEIEKAIASARKEASRPQLQRLACELADILGETLSAIVQHANWESELMRSLPQDELTVRLCTAHRQDHGRTVMKISALIENLHEIGLRACVADFASIMFDWLVDHIHQHDLPLRSMLLANGWTPEASEPPAEH